MYELPYPFPFLSFFSVLLLPGLGIKGTLALEDEFSNIIFLSILWTSLRKICYLCKDLVGFSCDSIWDLAFFSGETFYRLSYVCVSCFYLLSLTLAGQAYL